MEERRARCLSPGLWIQSLIVALLTVTLSASLHAQGTLRVAAYNVKHGLGLDGVVDLEVVP